MVSPFEAQIISNLCLFSGEIRKLKIIFAIYNPKTSIECHYDLFMHSMLFRFLADTINKMVT